MLKNKIQMMLNYKNKKQIDLVNVWEMSSRQSLNNKMMNERFSLADLVVLCDYLDLSITIKDKKTGNDVVTFDKEDLSKK